MRTIGVCILAFSGLCTCGTGFMLSYTHEAGGHPDLSVWMAPGLSFLVGFPLWFAGEWIVRRHTRPATMDKSHD